MGILSADVEGRDAELRYFRDVDKREVDFVLMDAKTAALHRMQDLIPRNQPGLRYLKIRFPDVKATQLLWIKY